MAKCGYTYDQILKIQSPFALSEDDLLMVSHCGTAKIISIGELSKFFSVDATYIPMQYSIQVPAGVSSVTISGSFASAVRVRGHIRYTGDGIDEGLEIARTIVNADSIVFILDRITYDNNYIIDYSYSERSSPYTYGKVQLVSGKNSVTVENVNFSKVDTIFGTIKNSDGDVVNSIGISDIKTTSNTATFVFSELIPTDDTYTLEYKYTLSYNNINSQLVDLHTGISNISISINEDLDIGHLVAEIYNNGSVDQEVYITNIERTGNTVVLTFNKTIPDNTNYKLKYYFVK